MKRSHDFCFNILDKTVSNIYADYTYNYHKNSKICDNKLYKYYKNYLLKLLGLLIIFKIMEKMNFKKKSLLQ